MRRFFGFRAAVLVTCVAALASVAGTCTLNFDPGDGGGVDTQLPLDSVALELSIVQSSPTAAQATATFRDSRGRRVALGDGQAIALNGVVVFEHGANGAIPVALAPATAYTITVTEPTRGVQATTVNAPPAFSIVSPGSGATVSLSGFTVAWDAVDPALQADVALSQTIFGEQHDAAVGPFTDTGSQVLAAANLAAFQQGAAVTITVSKTATVTGVAGFSSGTVRVRVAGGAVVVNPGP